MDINLITAKWKTLKLTSEEEQVTNLRSFAKTTKDEVLRTLGKKIGEVLEIDLPSSGGIWGRFARIRVKIDITKPLHRGIVIKAEDEGDNLLLPCRYEKLPEFCFACGLVGHTQKECDRIMKSGEDAGDLCYGPWMRAVEIKRLLETKEEEHEFKNFGIRRALDRGRRGSGCFQKRGNGREWWRKEVSDEDDSTPDSDSSGSGLPDGEEKLSDNGKGKKEDSLNALRGRLVGGFVG